MRCNFFPLLMEFLVNVLKPQKLANFFFGESNCLPILMYAMESIDLSISQCNEINLWGNSVSHKIFHLNYWDSVIELILYRERLDLNLYVLVKKSNFIKV